ncbi:MAG: hypothetical protein WA991_15580 [Ornithinimicrobium sp.]
MTLIIIRSRSFAPLAGAALMMVSLVACGEDDSSPGSASEQSSDEAEPSPDPSSSTAGQDEAVDAEESEEAVPRLVVAHEGGVDVLDVGSADPAPVGSIDLGTQPRLVVAPDDRHVFLVQSDDNRTQVLDAGSYSQPHGDHFHHYLREPALRPDVVEGDTPIHVVSHEGRTAIFNDGDGSVDLFKVADVTAGGLNVDTVSATSAHHGVAVPLTDGVLVSQSSTEEALPESMVLLDNDGQADREYMDSCPGLHGEAATGSVVAFGCSDGVLLLDGDTDTKVTYPDGEGEARVGSLYAAPHSNVLVGNYDDTHLASIDVDNPEIDTFDVSQPYGAITRGADGEVLVLGTDGVLRGFNPADGEPLGKVRAIDAFELPEGHGSPTPSLTVIGEDAYLTDPVSGSLVIIDTEGWAIEGEMDLGFSPAQVVATNASHDVDH